MNILLKTIAQLCGIAFTLILVLAVIIALDPKTEPKACASIGAQYDFMVNKGACFKIINDQIVLIPMPKQ